MTRKEIEDYILSMPSTRLDYPFGEDVAVYKVTVGDEDKMFALMPEKKTPVNLSLKCDPTLAVLLREKYETVLEGYHLNKKHWNTLLLTGQLEEQDIKDMIVHSYNLVIGNKDHVPSMK
ncbi:MAG: MmcQ/YjbR family DNA-binding protein [Candidatus Zixiibacteriota bacterium]